MFYVFVFVFVFVFVLGIPARRRGKYVTSCSWSPISHRLNYSDNSLDT